MKRLIKEAISQLTDNTVDYRIRLFYILALGGIAISVLTVFISLATKMWGTAIIGVILIIISAGLMAFTKKQENISLLI